MKARSTSTLAIILTVILVLMTVFSPKRVFSKDKSMKEINIYTAIEDEFLNEYVNEFEKDYPDIKVNIIRDSTGIVTARLLAEKDNPKADIVWGVAASSLLILDEEGSLYPYTPIGLENVDEKFYESKNEIPHWVGICLWTGAITVNTEELEKNGLPMPTSYTDLLNPIYKNEMIMPDPGSSGTGFLMVSGWLQNDGEENGWKFMDELNKNMKSYVHSGSLPTKSTATGEQAIGLGMDFESLRMENKTPQIKTVFPSDILPWEMEAVALINKPHVKDEAKTFVDWAISKKTMDMYAKNRSLVSLKGAKSQLKGMPEDLSERLCKNDFYWSSSNRKDILKEWNKRFSGEKK